MLARVPQAQFVDQSWREDVGIADSQSPGVQDFISRLDLLLVRRKGARQNGKTEDARVVEVEVLQDETPKNVVVRAELVVHTDPKSLAVGITLGMIKKVVPHAG